jgi:hypothetical protein
MYLISFQKMFTFGVEDFQPEVVKFLFSVTLFCNELSIT